ncbi:hypothetical protein [Sulfurivermis fontis]|jgi:hypothetical protein|uniref:hypothetical protein n=1 Tax=Sulfurivermis fontis TaxID=1972068 RepID=UPI000FD804CF|nr:hypothetical protein [Sulfurivermis fontis]
MQTPRPTPGNELSRERIRLMLMMRRMVREEFGVTVLLSETDATEELIAFAARARNTLLRQMGRELESLTATEAVPEPAAPAAPRYRGAPVTAAAQAPEGKSADVRRIYRGQVIG